ncbi:MAG: S8 family serine peptidase [bacterium]|nr:S8 family serine peptidase [bacterium]
MQSVLFAIPFVLLTLAMVEVSLADTRAGKGMNVDRILGNNRYHSPTGDGVLVGVTDAWLVDEDHEELAGRVIAMHDPADVDTTDFDGADFGHATAMAGNIASAGRLRSETRGPAPDATILSMLDSYEPNDEIAYAARTLGLRISHNAWGPDHDTEFQPPRRYPPFFAGAIRGLKASMGRLGYYGSFNRDLDKMILKADVLSVWANGNDAYLVPFYPLENGFGVPFVVDDWHRLNAGFDTSGLPSNSKNILSIGATMHDDVIAGFSSRGPAYDGRLSPHLVAPGYELQVLSPENEYGIGSGTSGSSAVAAGAAALILQQYSEIHGTEPSSALLKAILINSSRDLGPNGPDYTYGYGKLDAEYAAQTISGQEGVREYRKVLSRFVEDTIEHNETQAHAFEVKGNAKELRVTLAWHDAPKKRLVNDLDLWIRHGDGKKIRPLTLNPKRPQKPAKMKRNGRDTAEHIVVENPQAGEWTVFVEGKKVPKGPQPFALVVAAGKGNRRPIHKTEGDFTIEHFLVSKGNVDQPETRFAPGEDIYFHTLVDVHENAQYSDGYYGTMTARYELRDEAGVLRFVITSAWDNCAASVGGQLRDVQSRAQDIPDIEMIKGTYRVRSIVTMHNGVTKTAPNEYEVTLE